MTVRSLRCLNGSADVDVAEEVLSQLNEPPMKRWESGFKYKSYWRRRQDQEQQGRVR